jgi:hypothetical protein
MDWSMDWSTVFAGLLVLVTFGLFWMGRQQIQDARVLQRAYVSALPGGISTTTRGELLAHVEFKANGQWRASVLGLPACLIGLQPAPVTHARFETT